jgi:DNA-binding GntR family transcriptional regulator
MPMLDLRISPKPVQHQIVEKLREAIAAGRFRPGERLVEADLCEMFGVSRPSIREALRSLEGERLIWMIPNRGPQIPVLTWKQATEIYRVRALLEGEAAFVAAQRATAEDLKLMRASLAAFGKAVRANDEEKEISATAAFYGHILRVCANFVIEETLQGLLARINFLRGRSMSRPGRAKVSLQEMKLIFEAIAARNGSAARDAAIKHVENACSSAKDAYMASGLARHDLGQGSPSG